MIAYLIIQITLLMLLFLFITSVMVKQQSSRKLLIQSFTISAQQHKQQLLEAELNGQENTFRQVSSEIHDHVAHNLALCKLQLEVMKENRNQHTLATLETISTLLSDSLAYLSNLSKTLDHSPVVTNGLIKTLELTVSQLSRLGLFEVDFQVYGKPCRLEPIKELHVFRIIQEAINNVLKHAKARSLNIRCNFAGQHLECCIRDNGVGFDDHALIPGKTSGLNNMRKRAELIGAELTVSSIVSNGTLIRIYIPPQNPN